MTFFSSIVKVMKKSETKAENQAGTEPEEHDSHREQMFRRNTYDRHLIEVGCTSFTQLFTHCPMMDYLAEYDSLEVSGLCIGEALR